MKERGVRKGLIMKTLDRCLSKQKGREPLEGRFAVYVGGSGEARERFVVRTECVNHPLFRPLLEEAEEEYGYVADGPLELPCDARAFVGVLEKIEREMAEEKTTVKCSGLVRGHSAHRMMTMVPVRRPMIVG